MDVRWWLVGLALVAGSVSAQQVFKCVDGKKVSYQSAPCPNGQAAKAWDATPERVDPANQARLDALSQQLHMQNSGGQYAGRSGGRATGAQVSIAADDRACKAAKAHRDSVLKAVGTRRTFELLRSLDDQVYKACK